MKLTYKDLNNARHEVRNQVDTKIWFQVIDQVYDQVNTQVWNQVKTQVYENI